MQWASTAQRCSEPHWLWTQREAMELGTSSTCREHGMANNREIELKATIDPKRFDWVKDLPAIKKPTVGRVRSRKLVTVNFDTPDC